MQHLGNISRKITIFRQELIHESSFSAAEAAIGRQRSALPTCVLMHNAPSPPPYNAAPGKPPSPNRKAIKKGDRNRSRPDKRMPRAGPPEQKRCTPKIKRSPLQDSLPGWKKGFEPSTFGTTIRHSNQLSYIHHIDPPKHTPVQFPESVCKCNTFFRSVQAFSMKKRIFQGRHKRLFPKGRSACRIFFLSLPRMETPRTVRT